MLDKLLWEVEKEAMKLAFNKGGSWARYDELKAQADKALEEWIKQYEVKKI